MKGRLTVAKLKRRQVKGLGTQARPAQLVADAVAVLCPYCGEPQPNPTDGSEQWEKIHFKAYGESSAKTCTSCDAVMMIFNGPKAQFR